MCYSVVRKWTTTALIKWYVLKLEIKFSRVELQSDFMYLSVWKWVFGCSSYCAALFHSIDAELYTMHCIVCSWILLFARKTFSLYSFVSFFLSLCLFPPIFFHYFSLSLLLLSLLSWRALLSLPYYPSHLFLQSNRKSPAKYMTRSSKNVAPWPATITSNTPFCPI